jgi:hypothetical protein
MKNQPFAFKMLAIMAVVGCFVLFNAFQNETDTWLSSLDLTKMNHGAGGPVVDKNGDKSSLAIAGQKFEKGVGTRVKSYMWIDLAGGSDRFVSYVGVDDDTVKIGKPGLAYNTTHNFEIFADGKKLWESGPMNYGETAKKADINVKGVKTLILTVVNSGKGNSYVQLDWPFFHRLKKL